MATALNGYSNWMEAAAGIADPTSGNRTIMQKKLGELMLPGVHHCDSSTLGDQFSACSTGLLGSSILNMPLIPLPGMYAQLHAIAQRSTVTEQLHLGARYLDMRNCFDITSDPPQWRTHHTVYGAPSADALRQLRAFIEQSKQELVIIEVSYSKSKDDDLGSYPGDESLIEMVRKELQGLLYRRTDPQRPLVDYTLGEIVGNGSCVIALYNSGDFEKNKMAEDFEAYADLWPFSEHVNDMYDGVQSIAKLDAFLGSQLMDETKQAGKLNKLQYILEWTAELLATPSLEWIEAGLPDSIKNFLSGYKDSRINVVFVDFYEKNADYLMQTAVAHNTGSTAMLDGLIVPDTDGELAVGQVYTITCKRMIGDGTVYNLRLISNGLEAVPADPAEPTQHFQLQLNPSGGGYALFHPASNKFVSQKHEQKDGRVVTDRYPLVGVAPPEADTIYTGFSLTRHQPFVYTISMTSVNEANTVLDNLGHMLFVFDVRGDIPVRDHNWSPPQVGLWDGGRADKQQWWFATLADGIPIPSSDGLRMGRTYQLICRAGHEENAITIDGDKDNNFSLLLERASIDNRRQHWTLVANTNGIGISLLNAACRRYVSLPRNPQQGSKAELTEDPFGNTGTNGCFRIFAHGGGNSLRASSNEHLHLEARGRSGQAGDEVWFWGWNGRDNQTFVFRPVEHE